MPRPSRSWSALLLTLALQALPAADDPATATLPLRAALHEDATLEAPLTQLVDAWRQAERLPDLLTLYRTHLSQYPQDMGATIVLVRLLQVTRDPATAAATRQAVTDFPESAYLRWLAFQALNDVRDPAALDHLAKAVELETVTWRRDQWTERLVSEAVKRGRRDLIERHLTSAATQETSAAGKLAIGRRQALAGLHDAALTTFAAALAADPAPEVLVDLQVEAAASEAALKKPADAAQRLDALLARLGPDHWRRAEITRRRLELAGAESERAAMIAAARARVEANPADDGPALDLARLLMAVDRRRDALAVLTTATTGERGGNRLEQELLTLHERLHDPTALDAWLAQRLKAQPGRTDLALRRVRTLIDLGKGDEALALRRQVASGFSGNERGERLLALARELRRDGRHAEAAQVLEDLLAADPNRIDLTRELSEAWLAAGNRGRADELLARELPASAAPEQVLDLVQFLLSAKQYLAASRAISARLALDPGFFELRVQAIRLAGRTGDVRGATQAAQEARALTDTAARYRLWLEAAVEAVGEERDAAWLEQEQRRLADVGGAWDAQRLERLLAFADLCVARDRGAPALALLDAALDDPQLPTDQHAGLRRRVVALIEHLPEAVDRLSDELTQLASDDPALAMECRARAALLGFDPTFQSNSGDVAQQLRGIDIEKVSDAALVTRMESAMSAAGDTQASLACLKRLTVLEPATASHWERWLSALSANGNESALRDAIRRLLAGIDNLELKDDIRTQLAGRLADSCWRSAAAQAARGNELGWQAVLALLDEAGATSLKADSGWILAGRVLALHHLGRHEARDQVLHEIDTDASLTFTFPDGLGTSREALHAMVTDAPAAFTAAPTRSLPPAPWTITWSAAFTKAVHGVWLTDERVLVMLDNTSLIALDRASGRRLWEMAPQRHDPTPTPDPYTGNVRMIRSAMLRPVVVGSRVVMATGQEVRAYAISDGKLAWRCNLMEAEGVLANERVVLAWSDRLGLAIGLDPADGRLRWSCELPTLTNTQSTGASQSLSGDHAILLGQHAAVLDVRSGAICWSFSDEGVEQPTVTLSPTPAATAGAPVNPSALRRMRRWRQVSAYSVVAYNQNPFAFYHGTPPGEPPVSWMTTVISRARQPGASVALVGGDLLIGDWNSAAVIPLSLPLRSTQLPNGTLIGAYGRSGLLLNAQDAQVCSLDDGSLIASIPLSDLQAPKKEGLIEENAGSTWISGVVNGRLAWLSGPGGVLTLDLDRCEVVDRQAWAQDWSVAPGDVANWLLGGAIISSNNPYGTNIERLPVGVVSEGLAVLPVGSQRLVALQAGAPVPKNTTPAGGSDGR